MSHRGAKRAFPWANLLLYCIAFHPRRFLFPLLFSRSGIFHHRPWQVFTATRWAHAPLRFSQTVAAAARVSARVLFFFFPLSSKLSAQLDLTPLGFKRTTMSLDEKYVRRPWNKWEYQWKINDKIMNWSKTSWCYSTKKNFPLCASLSSKTFFDGATAEKIDFHPRFDNNLFILLQGIGRGWKQWLFPSCEVL